MARSTAADPRLGTTIADYRIVALAGRGGMSVVYRARDERLGRDVALKLLSPELTDDDQFRRRFLRESQVAASLHHPNIVPVYAAGEADGNLYLAMRYVEGADLKALLRRESTLSPERALAVLGQVAAALDTAHRHHLVHRDVKPANILLEGAPPEENGYLADFGLTKTDASHAATMTGQLVGTLDYVAPEQIRGQTLDGRADIYSLACVLYECLVGSPPFASSSEVAVLYAHLQHPPPSTSQGRPGLSSAIDAVLARALAKRAEERHHSAGELVADAREALAGAGALPSLPLTEHGRLRLRLEQTFRPITRAPRRLLRTMAASLAAIALVVGADRAGAFDRPDREAFDLSMSLRGEHDAPDVLIVRMDVDALGRPSLNAQAIKRLSDAGARAIAYTTSIAIPGPGPKLTELVNAVDRGNVVLMAAAIDRQHYLGGVPHGRVGHVVLRPDGDGVIRRVPPYSDGGLTSLAVETASLALGRPIPRSEADPNGAWIDFAGPRGKIPRLSFRDVLDGSFDARRVRGKVAVIGSPGLQELHDIPVGNRMPDWEVQANAIQTALDGFPLRDAPKPVGALAIVVLGIAGMLVALRLGRFKGLGAAFVLAAVYLVVVQGAFDADIVLPVSYPLGALAAATFAVPLTRGW